MTTPIRSDYEIASSALDNLESAKRALCRLESLLCAASISSGTGQHVRNLIDIGWTIAADAAATASSDCEEIGQGLIESAPQIAESQNVARVSEVDHD